MRLFCRFASAKVTLRFIQSPWEDPSVTKKELSSFKTRELGESSEGEGDGAGEGAGEGEGEGDEVVVSMLKVTELLASEPSLLVLPEESENFELATEITPSVVLLSVGVKVAV